MKNILITGGAGFIGSHLAERLLEEGNSVTIYDNFMRGEESEKNVNEIKQNIGGKNLEVIVADILDFEKLKKAVEGKDNVYHLAALPSHRLALQQPKDYAMVDVIGTVNVLEAARLTNSPHVLFASSNKIYGKRDTPFKETDAPKPEGPYGLSKFCSEKFCEMYVNYYGLDATVIRYHHVIGPRCQPDRELSIFTERVLDGLSPIVHGHFENDSFNSCAADYTNIYDTVEATVLASKLKGFNVFNLATGRVTKVSEMAEWIISILEKKDIKPELKEMLPHESLLHWADVSKIKEVLGFEAKTSAKTSVEQYIDWRLKTGPRKQAVYK